MIEKERENLEREIASFIEGLGQEGRTVSDVTRSIIDTIEYYEDRGAIGNVQ